MGLAEQKTFIANFLKRPGQVGAIAPSSSRLAETMVEWIDWENAKAVVEYGPGTGVFTEAIQRRLRPGCKFFAIERSPDFVAAVRQRCPGVTVYEESVENVERLCQQEGIQQVDAILCGLPWASFSEALQRSCMDAMIRILRPGAQFATFAYWQGVILPAGIRFHRKLGKFFSKVEKSRTVWGNIPPAFVYRCNR